MRVVCKLIVSISVSLASVAFASENYKFETSGFEQTMQLLTQAGMEAQKAKKTVDKMGVVNESLKIISHTDTLIQAYAKLALRQIDIIQDTESSLEDQELAQDSLNNTVNKIINLRDKRTLLVSKINSLVSIGTKSSVLEAPKISLFDIPEPATLEPNLEKLLQ